MQKRKQRNYFSAFIGLYFILNIINTYFLTSQILNRYIAPFERSFIGEVTAVLGNFSILFMILLIGFSIFKKEKGRLVYLLIITGFLNFLIFGLGFFNLFYGTSFSTNALDIFKNPASGGIAQGLGTELIKELFVYYRILVFVPVITLSVMLLKYDKYARITEDHTLIKRTPKRMLMGLLSFVLIFGLSTTSFIGQLSKDDFTIGSVISTKGVQNYGVYPYYFTSLFGVQFNRTSKKAAGIENEEDIKSSYDLFNKNVNEYTNIIDGKKYSNNTLLKDSVVTSGEMLNLNPEDSLNGIFKDKNLVLVHLESLNYFLWQIPEIKERFTFLNKLFEESFVFENYFTSVGMGVSSDAEATVLTGLDMNGYETFYRSYEKRNHEVDTLAKLFANQGYRSQAVHADTEKFYNRDVAYPNLIGFTEDYFSSEDFAKKAGYDSVKKYGKDRNKNGVMYNHYKYDEPIKLISPWASEFELSDVTYELSEQMKNDKHMLFSIYMTPHTPFLFNPHMNESYSEFKKLNSITARYIEFVKYVDETIESYFVDPKTGQPRDLTDNVYVFYSDHGSSLKNGDLSILFDRKVPLMEERLMLQQTMAFIYAPSNISTDTLGINKGLLTGRQKLARGHVDLYRTIGDLFGIFDESNFFFGASGLSNEPTFVIDNRIQDLVVDDLNNIDKDNYVPFFVSMRNKKNRIEGTYIDNEVQILTKIKHYKRLSDLLLKDPSVYKQYKNSLQN